MTPVSAADFISLVGQYRLTDRVTALQSMASRFGDAKSLGEELIRRNCLTEYQVGQILRGNAEDLVLGSYVVLERLGQGGMGQVFKAHHELMNRLVALKLIRSDLRASPELVERFRREIRAVAALSHPHIIAAYDAQMIGDRFFLVMEYGPGLNLGQHVRKHGPLPVGQACEFFRHAALGLQHAWEKGILHRDIKPENLLITESGLKILDLGLARLQTSDGPVAGLTESGAIVGTPDYMTPERTSGSDPIDIRSDLYSLGCTFYFALTGQVPFPGGDIIEKVLRHRMEEPVAMERLRQGMPQPVLAIQRRLMAKLPADRFQTPAELAAALAPFAASPENATSTPWVISVSQLKVSEEVSTGKAPPLPFAHAPIPPTPPISARKPLKADQPSRKSRKLIWLSAFVLTAGLTVWGVHFLSSRPSLKTTQDGQSPQPGASNGIERLEPLGIELEAQADEVNAVAFAPKSGLLAIGCGSLREPKKAGYVQIRDLDGKLLGTLSDHPTGVMALAFSANGQTLATATCNADQVVTGEVHVWDVATRHLLAVLEADPNGVNAVAIHPKGFFLATAGRDKQIHVWDLKLIHTRGFFAPDTRWTTASEAHLKPLRGHTENVNTLAFSPDGQQLASGGNDKRLRIWDWSGGEEITSFPSRRGGAVYRLAYSPDGRYLAAGTGKFKDAEFTPEIMLCHVADQRLDQRNWELPRDVTSVAFAPDNQTLLLGDKDGFLHIWDVVGAKALETKRPHRNGLWSIAFAPEGQRIATGSWDKSVLLWRWNAGNR